MTSYCKLSNELFQVGDNLLQVKSWAKQNYWLTRIGCGIISWLKHVLFVTTLKFGLKEHTHVYLVVKNVMIVENEHFVIFVG